MLLNVGAAGLNRRRKPWLLFQFVDLPGEVVVHGVRNVGQSVLVRAVFGGLDIVVTEGKGSFRNHTAADGSPCDQSDGNNQLILSLTQRIAGTQSARYMGACVLAEKIIRSRSIKNISILHMGKTALLQKISAMSTWNVLRLKKRLL